MPQQVWGSLRPRNAFAALLGVLLFTHAPESAVAQPTPIAGQNINMVSGTKWPGGDPFLQRQNEPSLAVSSRNPLHLLAGANDYRTVDLPVSDTLPGSLAGDAWLGVFKSFDGGQIWQSTLLPGYPQDQSPVGMASPLKAYTAAADPTVRAGAGGVFYYSGIAFNRGTNIGAVFLSRFFDQNSKENGDATQGKDTVAFLDTKLIDTGTSGQFLDKPWIAVDIYRSTSGAMPCSFTLPSGQTVSSPGGNVYMTWSRFTGSSSTKIMFSRSLDCGKSWSTPIKLSESNSINQGTNIAVDPVSGNVFVAWRRFASSSQPDAILVARSTDFGNTFPSKYTTQVATIAPFDQPTTTTEFRTNALPSIAMSVDSTNVSRVHVAWAQRNPTTGDAQIVLSTSADGLSWSSPVAVDAMPLVDDFGNSFARGHQFMPQLTFAAGRLMLLYYDQRLDHTLGFHFPNNPFEPDAQGRFYLVQNDPRGELPSSPGLVFTSFLDDALLTIRRHTIDLRVAEAVPNASPVFSSSGVSQYRFGLRAVDDPDRPLGSLEQLQDNPPNLPLFEQGTVPFLGDYIDIAGQVFKANGDGTYSFNTSQASPPVFYASWTDNRDVKPPLDGDWTHYTPAGGGTTSVLDPTQTTPLCVNGQEGMRNQNIYSSRITEGLLVGSPQDAKPLSPTLQRAFVVTMQNFTPQDRTFTVTLAPQAGVNASFLQTSSLGSLIVTIPARSGAARPVFATSSNPAGSITVNVVESGVNSIGLSGSIILNPEGSVSPLAQPDGTIADIGSLEIYTPSLEVWNSTSNAFLNISNPNLSLNISNLNISNADPSILNISNLNISNLNISNLNISNPDPAILNISNLNISNTTAANLNISNLNISNLNISNTTISDTTYAVTNSGNTTHSYHVALYGNNPNNVPLQLIVTKNSTTTTSVNCQLQNLPQSVVVANVNNAVIAPTLAAAADPDIPDSSATNATVAIAPGETVFVTLRGPLTSDQMTQLVQQLTPVVTAHGTNTNGVTPDFAALLFIQTGTSNLQPATVGVPYSVTLQSTGGKAPITWIVVGGSLPPGLSLSTGGVLSGTPSGSGVFTFTVQASDSSTPTETANQSITVTVNGRSTSTSVSFGSNPVVVGQADPVTVTVTDTQGGGGASSPTGTVTFSGDPGLSAATCTLAPSAVTGVSTCQVTLTPGSAGAHNISASYPGSIVHQASSGSGTLTANQAATSTVVASNANPSVFGQPVTFTATVTVTPPGTGSPTGTVTFSDGATVLGATALSGTTATFTTSTLAVGGHSIVAAYSGDPNFGGSNASPLAQTVNKANTTEVVASTPLSPVFGQPVTFTATVSAVAPGAGTPTGTVTFLDGPVSLGTVILSGGVGTFTTSTLAAGNHSVTASYGGDANFTSGSSAVFVQTIGKAATQTAVVSSQNPSVFGQSVTLTATVKAVSPGAGTPTGSVIFFDGASAIGTVALSGGGASFTTAALTAGAHTITASYGGDSNFLISSSAGLAQTVNKANATASLVSNLNPSFFGQAVTLTATLAVTAPGAGTPTGTVTFYDGAAALGSSGLSGSSASFTTSSLAIGSHSITAGYGGDSNFNGSTSAVLTQVVKMPFYTFIGFLTPLSTAGTLTSPSISGTQNFGSAVPVKWQLKDFTGSFVTSLTSTQVLQAVFYPGAACSGQAGGQVFLLYSPTSGATGGSTFRYDTTNNQFIFNWATSALTTGAGCYEVELQLNDGSPVKATTLRLQ